MEQIQVCYSTNKAGTYIQFKWPVTSCELNELVEYDKYLQDQIWQEFGSLAEDFGLEFYTDSSYLIHEDENQYLVICLQGKTSEKLEDTLVKMGISKVGD